jgi:uncharacterized protein (TIGR02996 family)
VTAPASYPEHLAAILRAPDDDPPRLALADFVRPSEPELARFIYLQIAEASRERDPDPPGFTEMTAEERDLLARNAAAWTRLIAPYAPRTADGAVACTFHRGLIAQVTVDPEAFLAHAARLLTSAPIRHVDFASLAPGVLPRLLACDALAQLDSIGLVGVGLDDDGVAALAACPRLARCVYLDLSANPLGPRAFEAIAASPHLRQLLVVERAQAAELTAAQTWHPGEVVVRERSAAGSSSTLLHMRAEGFALEARHGYLPWLHIDERVARLDARWFVDHGFRPYQRPGTPGSPP